MSGQVDLLSFQNLWLPMLNMRISFKVLKVSRSKCNKK